MVEPLTAIKGAWELAKRVKTAADALGNAGIKMQVAELMSALADVKIEAADASERIAELEKQLRAKADLKFNGVVYYGTDDDGKQDGPFCPACFDSTDKQIRLHRGYQGSWVCRTCSNGFS